MPLTTSNFNLVLILLFISFDEVLSKLYVRTTSLANRIFYYFNYGPSRIKVRCTLNLLVLNIKPKAFLCEIN